MEHPNKKDSQISFLRTISILLIIAFICGCSRAPSKDAAQPFDLTPKIAPESLHFKPTVLKLHDDGSREETDTITGYRKYYYNNGRLQMEGKVTKATPKDYRDGIWNYYNEGGQLMSQETYNREGKLTSLACLYFMNGQPFKKTYQYFHGDYRNKMSFKFHKVEVLYYTNGRAMSGRHSINGIIVEEKDWDSSGFSRPAEYLKRIKSVQTK